MVEAVGHLVGGEWTEARPDAVSTNPAHPRDEVGRHAIATTEEADRAVAAARHALVHWQAVGPIARAQIVARAATELGARLEHVAALVTREEGKTLGEARGEVRRAAEALSYHAAQAWAPTGETFASMSAGEEIRTVRCPVGVVLAVTPWNFPVAIPAWKIAPALVWGNTVVWKPASLTPMVAVELATALQRAGLPPGVLNVVFGGGEIGAHLVRSPGVDAITFTGSTAVGKPIWRDATARGVKVQLELGGHNPAIVFDDADLDVAAAEIVRGAMGSSGQKCTATRRVVVLESAYGALATRIEALARALRVGDGLDENVEMGPLVSDTALERVGAGVAEAIVEGADALCGGEALRAPELDGGHYYAPTVLRGVRPTDVVAQEEIFGPLTALIEVADDDEAIEVANATRYGLCASVFTRSPDRVRRVVADVEVGAIHVNRATTGSMGAQVHVPFGGVRDSGSQAPREQGQTAREFFTELKTVYGEAIS